MGVFPAMLGMQLVGTLLYGAALALLGRWPLLSWDAVPLSCAIAVLGLVGLLFFYRALALGPIAVVSPIGAAYVAVAVLLAVAFLGERLTTAQIIAIGVTTFGIVLTATDGRTLARALGRPLPGVWLALVAMISFGGWAALMAYSTRVQDGLATILLQRVVSVVFTIGILALLRRRMAAGMSATTLAIVVATGTFDTLANVFYVLGVQSGFVSIVATASGVYPIITAFLAFTVLGERLAANQYIGIVVLLAGLVVLGLNV